MKKGRNEKLNGIKEDLPEKDETHDSYQKVQQEQKEQLEQKEQKEQKDQIQSRDVQGPSIMTGPGPRPGHPPFSQGKAKLEHPRKVLYSWIFQFLKPFKKQLYLYLVLLIIATIIQSINPLIVARIIDQGISDSNYNYLIKMTIVYGSFILIISFSNYVALFGMSKTSQQVTYDVRNKIFYQLQDMSLTYFDKRPSGDIISIATNDVDQLNMLVGGQFTQIITSIITIILTIIFMFRLNPILAASSLVVIPLFLYFINLFKKRTSSSFKAARKTISQVTSTIQENIAGAKVVQAYGQETKAMSEFEKANKADYDANIKIRRVFAAFFPLINFVTTAITVAILVEGGFLIINNISIFGIAVSVGVLTSFITFLAEFFRPFMTLMQIQQIIESALAATDRIYSLLEEFVEIPDPAQPKEFQSIKGTIDFENVSFGYTIDEKKGKIENHQKNMMNGVISSEGVNGMGGNKLTPESILNMVKIIEKSLSSAASIGSGSGSMEGGGMMGPNMKMQGSKNMLEILASIPLDDSVLEQIPEVVQQAIKETKQRMEHKKSIGYVLENMDLTIPSGSTLAIVGETGAGKTTIVKLIVRFYDVVSGAIKIDGIDIRDIKKQDLRKIIGMVPQDAFLFSGTIRDNLLYSIDDITPEIEEKMIEISKFLGLHNFIEVLPEKYDTILKEMASNISIGQRQLIAFARALLKDPKILILDEATSSVDPYTESLIQDALDKARKGRTTIIIAHRLSTIKNADHIVVIGKEKRGIVEQGTHEELLAKNGKYKRLLEMQFKEIAESDKK